MARRSSGFVLSDAESKENSAKLKLTEKVTPTPADTAQIPQGSYGLMRLNLTILQGLFRLKAHVDDDKQQWGSADYSVTALDPSRPASVVPSDMNQSYYEMYNYFKDLGHWSKDDLSTLQDYSKQGGGATQTQFLVKHGFLKEINPTWVDLYPSKFKPQPSYGFVAKEPDGIKTFSMKQNNLPPINVEIRKKTEKKLIGKYPKGAKKYKTQTKYSQKYYEYEVTPEGQKYIQGDFGNLESMKGVSALETSLPFKNELLIEDNSSKPELLEDVTYEVLPSNETPVDVPNDTDEPPTYAEEKPLRTPTRQEAIQQAKDRKSEREQRKKSRGYVNKPGAGKPPAELSAPKMPPLGGRRSTTSEAAGRGALPGGGGGGKQIDMFNPRKLPKRDLRAGGFVPYST